MMERAKAHQLLDKQIDRLIAARRGDRAKAFDGYDHEEAMLAHHMRAAAIEEATQPVPQPPGATCRESTSFASYLCGNLLPCSTHPTCACGHDHDRRPNSYGMDPFCHECNDRCAPVPPSGDVVLVNESAEMEAEWLKQRDKFRYYSARAGFEAGWLARAAKEKRTP